MLPDYIYANYIIQNPSFFGIDLIGELNWSTDSNLYPLSFKFDSAINL